MNSLIQKEIYSFIMNYILKSNLKSFGKKIQRQNFL